MYNFVYRNPVEISFGKGVIKNLAKYLKNRRILLTYGQGSIKGNGVYDQVLNALLGNVVVEFSGIEANPTYETCMKAVKVVKQEKVDFILAVGGGSVLDAVKFIAAAALFDGPEPWDILTKGVKIKKALPLGSVLTLPATGSEMNMNAVISRPETGEKLAFMDPHVFPQFSILDPETTFSLPRKQITNGIVDAFVHVMEQYMTFPNAAPLQDRQAEAILLTLIEEGPKALETPMDYNARANIMWCATQALNGNIAVGLTQDWTTHVIGHELTAKYGIDHAQSLAVVMPAVWKHQIENKREKLVQYGDRVLCPGRSCTALDVIESTVSFFHQIEMKTDKANYGIDPFDYEWIATQISNRNQRLGEHENIGKKEILEILSLLD